MGQLVNKNEQEMTLWKPTFFCYSPGNRSYLHLFKKLLMSIYIHFWKLITDHINAAKYTFIIFDFQSKHSFLTCETTSKA